MNTDDRLPLCDDDWHYRTPQPAGGCPACDGLRWTLDDEPPTVAVEHPDWCDRTHVDSSAHSGQIGADLEITGGLSYAVYVARNGGEPAEVQLLEHTTKNTTLTGFSIVQASILRDLLTEALSVLAEEVGR